MIVKLTLGAAALVAAALLTPLAAAPLGQTTQAPVDVANEGLVEQVHRRGRRHFRGGHRFRHYRGSRRHFHGGRRYHRWHRHRHHRWRRHRHFHGFPFVYGSFYTGRSCSYRRYRCAARYGWHTGGYYRCVWRSGC